MLSPSKFIVNKILYIIKNLDVTLDTLILNEYKKALKVYLYLLYYS